ncbi:MAG: tRNA pseudouridine(13) synthase TruD [bacterium]|nr:tRNA pseudouridine(13) synthase TruD [bacterium]
MEWTWSTRRWEILDPAPLLEGERLRGLIRAVPEDFVVEEVPAYEPDGGEGHLFLTLTKRGWTTDAALHEVARQLGLPRGEIGVAGLKDRHALTTQWISLPAAGAARHGDFQHADLQLGAPHPHRHKLRRGHLKGNRFRITLRELDRPAAPALELARDRAERLAEAGGMGHLFGRQRFGPDGRNVDLGLRLLGQPRRLRPGDFALSALQGALFNLFWCLRRERGQLRTVLGGDILQKTETGGLFSSADPVTDQQRLEAGELRITGPIFGADRLVPPPDSPARALEEEVLAAFGLARVQWTGLGKKAPGTRRALQTQAGGLTIQAGGEGASLVLDFELEAGAFATRLLGEMADWREAERGGADPDLAQGTRA